MVMFPSYLLHTVYPFIGKEERRCIAFNGTYRITNEKNEFIAGSFLDANKINILQTRER